MAPYISVLSRGLPKVFIRTQQTRKLKGLQAFFCTATLFLCTDRILRVSVLYSVSQNRSCFIAEFFGRSHITIHFPPFTVCIYSGLNYALETAFHIADSPFTGFNLGKNQIFPLVSHRAAKCQHNIDRFLSQLLLCPVRIQHHGTKAIFLFYLAENAHGLRTKHLKITVTQG